MLPYLDKKSSMLEQELSQAENEIKDLKKTIADLGKENKEVATKINMLEERRNTRLSLEQDNLGLKKKVSELEGEIDQIRKELKESRSKKDQLEQTCIKSEDYKKEIAKMGVEKVAFLQKANDLIDERKELMTKIAKYRSSDELLNNEINALKQKQIELLETIEKFQSSNQAAYVLDREKLAELKDFTLEAIQARRWKSPEFVNGAYDAIGLFYRTLLSDRPIQKKLK